MTPHLQRLLDRSRGPTGQPRDVDLEAETGPLAELGALLSTRNGFFVFNAGIQIYRAGDPGQGPELQHWNATSTWKDTYGGLADGLWYFGQDLFGRQFAVENNTRVVAFDPETAEHTTIGNSLESWAAWLFDDPDVNGTLGYAAAWQDHNGSLTPDQRLIPLQFFTLGGSYDFDNIVVKDARTCMRIRGPLAQQLHDLPDGAQLRLTPERPSPASRSSQQLVYAELNVFADYNSFIVQDEAADIEAGRDWIRALLRDLIAAAPGAVGVATARRVTVPVILDVRSSEPDDDLDGWDHVTQASLTTRTGRVLVSHFDYGDTIPRFSIPAGTYTVRVYYKGFRTISPDGLHGDDLYRVVMWPGADQEPEVLKRYPDPLPGG